MMWTTEARRIFCCGGEDRMKEIVPIERIAAARQHLSELSNGLPGREIQVRQAVHLLSKLLDELETAAKDSKHEEEAAGQSLTMGTRVSDF
jgi:hypothetical protein